MAKSGGTDERGRPKERDCQPCRQYLRFRKTAPDSGPCHASARRSRHRCDWSRRFAWRRAMRSSAAEAAWNPRGLSSRYPRQASCWLLLAKALRTGAPPSLVRPPVWPLGIAPRIFRPTVGRLFVVPHEHTRLPALSISRSAAVDPSFGGSAFLRDIGAFRRASSAETLAALDPKRTSTSPAPRPAIRLVVSRTRQR